MRGSLDGWLTKCHFDECWVNLPRCGASLSLIRNYPTHGLCASISCERDLFCGTHMHEPLDPMRLPAHTIRVARFFPAFGMFVRAAVWPGSHVALTSAFAQVRRSTYAQHDCS